MKRKVLISVLILALTLSLCLGLLVACNPDEQTTGSYTVTFSLGEYEGADPPAAMQADSNGKIVLPSAAQWPGHDFLGWQADGSSEYLQPGTEYTVPKNITLVAKWTESASTPQTYTVTLKDGDDVDTFKVSEGNSLGTNLPATGKSQDERKQFKGWYLADEQGAATSQQVTSEYEPASDVTLIAVYDEVWLVTLQDEGASKDVVLKVVKGQAIGSQLPAAGAITDDAHKEFVGWYIGGGVRKIEGTYAPESDVTLTARYNTYYLVTVKIDGQAEAAPRKVLVAEPKNSLQLEASEELDHRIFKGWYMEGEDAAFSTSATASYTPNGDVTLEARYNDLYTLTFKDCDEEDGQKKDRIVKLEKGVALGTGLPTATFDPNRFEFVGWYVADADGAPTEAQVTADFTTEADVTIVAKFNNKYAIEFYDGGALVKTLYFVSGTVLGDSDKAQFPNTTPAADKQFDGWYLMDGDDQTDNPFDATQAITADVKVYAKYSNNYWLLTFVDGDEQTEVKVTKGQTLGTQLPQDPTPKEGKYFNGWFVANDGGTASETKVDNTFKPEKDLKIVADYKDMYKVTLKGATVEYVYVKPGDALPELTPKASEADEGKAFGGWYIMKGAEPADDDDKIEKANEYKPTGNVTIYAKFVEPAVENYTVHFKNGENVQDVEVPTNAAIGEKLPTAPADTDETYFAGWFLANDASYVATDTQITSSYKPTDGVTEVYAVAVFKQFLKVTLKDGQSSKIVKVKQGASVPAADLNPATPADYSFDGWFVSEDGENPTETKFDDKTVVEQDMTVIAKYTLAVWYVTFKGECIKDGDSDGTQKVLKVQKGTKLGTLPEIEESKLDHKRFDKWVIENTDTTVTTEYEPAGDITVVAKYIDTVTITFVYGPNNMPITIDKGVAIGAEKLAAPEDYNPEHVGAFLGWYRDGGEGAKVEATDTFDEDTTLTAKYANLIDESYVGEWNAYYDGHLYHLYVYPDDEPFTGTFGVDTHLTNAVIVLVVTPIGSGNGDLYDAQVTNVTGDKANGYYFGVGGKLSIKLADELMTYKDSSKPDLSVSMTKVKDQYTVQFIDDIGSRYESVTVDKFTKIPSEKFPTPQSKEGFRFLGWFVADRENRATSMQVTTDYEVISDITAIAVYEPLPVATDSISSYYQGAYYGYDADTMRAYYLLVKPTYIQIMATTGSFYMDERFVFVVNIKAICSDGNILGNNELGYYVENYKLQLVYGEADNASGIQLTDDQNNSINMRKDAYQVQYLDEDGELFGVSFVTQMATAGQPTALGASILNNDEYLQQHGRLFKGWYWVNESDMQITNTLIRWNNKYQNIDSGEVNYYGDTLIILQQKWEDIEDAHPAEIKSLFVGQWHLESTSSSCDLTITSDSITYDMYNSNHEKTTYTAALSSDIWANNGFYSYFNSNNLELNAKYKLDINNSLYISFMKDGEFFSNYAIMVKDEELTLFNLKEKAQTAFEKVIPLAESIDGSYIGSYSSLTAEVAQDIYKVDVTAEGVKITLIKGEAAATTYEYTIAAEQIRGTAESGYTLGDKAFSLIKTADGITLTALEGADGAFSGDKALNKLADDKKYIEFTLKDGDAFIGYAQIEAGQKLTLAEVTSSDVSKIADGWVLVKEGGNVKVTSDTTYIVEGSAEDGQVLIEETDGSYLATLSKSYIDLGEKLTSLDENYDGGWTLEEGEDVIVIAAATANVTIGSTQATAVFNALEGGEGYIVAMSKSGGYDYKVIAIGEDSKLALSDLGSDEKTYYIADEKPVSSIDPSFYGVWSPGSRYIIIEDDEDGIAHIIYINGSNSSSYSETEYKLEQVFGSAEQGYRVEGITIAKSSTNGKLSIAISDYNSGRASDYTKYGYVVKRLDAEGNIKGYSTLNEGSSITTYTPDSRKGKFVDWHIVRDGEIGEVVTRNLTQAIKSGEPSENQILVEGNIITIQLVYTDPGTVIEAIGNDYIGYWKGDTSASNPSADAYKIIYYVTISETEIIVEYYSGSNINSKDSPWTVNPTGKMTKFSVPVSSVWQTEEGLTFDKEGNSTSSSSTYWSLALNEGKDELTIHQFASSYCDYDGKLKKDTAPTQPDSIDDAYLGAWMNSTGSVEVMAIVEKDSIILITNVNSIQPGPSETKYSIADMFGNATDGYSFGLNKLIYSDGTMTLNYAKTNYSGSISNEQKTLTKQAYIIKYLNADDSLYQYSYQSTEGQQLATSSYDSNNPIDKTFDAMSVKAFDGWYLVGADGSMTDTKLTYQSKPVKTAKDDYADGEFLAEGNLIVIQAKFSLMGDVIESVDAKFQGIWMGYNSHYSTPSKNKSEAHFYVLTITSTGAKIVCYTKIFEYDESATPSYTYQTLSIADIVKYDDNTLYIGVYTDSGTFADNFRLVFDGEDGVVTHKMKETAYNDYDGHLEHQPDPIDESYIGLYADSNEKMLLIVTSKDITLITQEGSSSNYTLSVTTIKAGLTDITGDATNGYTFNGKNVKLVSDSLKVSDVGSYSSTSLNKVTWLIEYQKDDGSVYGYSTITGNAAISKKDNDGPIRSDVIPAQAGKIFEGWYLVGADGNLTDTKVIYSNTPILEANGRDSYVVVPDSYFILRQKYTALEAVESFGAELVGTWENEDKSVSFIVSAMKNQIAYNVKDNTNSYTMSIGTDNFYKTGDNEYYAFVTYRTTFSDESKYIKIALDGESLVITDMSVSGAWKECSLTRTNSSDPFEGQEEGQLPSYADLGGSYKYDAGLNSIIIVLSSEDNTCTVQQGMFGGTTPATYEIKSGDNGDIIISISGSGTDCDGDYVYDALTHTLTKGDTVLNRQA